MWPDQRRRESHGNYDGTTSDLVSTGTDTSPLLDTPPPHAWHVSVLNFLVMTQFESSHQDMDEWDPSGSPGL